MAQSIVGVLILTVLLLLLTGLVGAILFGNNKS